MRRDRSPARRLGTVAQDNWTRRREIPTSSGRSAGGSRQVPSTACTAFLPARELRLAPAPEPLDSEERATKRAESNLEGTLSPARFLRRLRRAAGWEQERSSPRQLARREPPAPPAVKAYDPFRQETSLGRQDAGMAGQIEPTGLPKFG